MHPKFVVRVAGADSIAAVEGMWTPQEKQALMAHVMDEAIEGTEAEVDEYLLMALQDMSPQDCGEVVLEHVLGDSLTPGQRFEVSRDMRDDKPWEQYSRMDCHRHIFQAAAMVHRAHRAKVTTPKAVRLTLALTPMNNAARAALTRSLTPAMAARLVGPLHPEGILFRLFDDAIGGDPFPEASDIFWRCVWSGSSDVSTEATATVEGSEHWLGDCEPGDELTIEAYNDVPS